MLAAAIQLVRHAQNWEEELASTLSDQKKDERERVPVCVARLHHIVATVHGDYITVGGERSVVEFFMKMMSRKYEIEEQVIGEDPVLEKSGRILNRVIKWNHNGITIEADQRHVREILKGLELEQANCSATPRGVERIDEGKGESRCRQEEIQAGHEWDNANNGDDRDRPQMADDDDSDSQAFTNGDITRYRALMARISYLSQDPPHLKFVSMQVCCAMAKPSVREMERVMRIGRYFAGKPRAKCWFRWQQSVELEAYLDADWRGDKATRRLVSARIIMSHHERRTLASRYGPRNSKWYRSRPPRASCTPQSKTAPEGLGIQSVAKDLEISCGLNLHSDASATMCLVNRGGLGKAKHVDMQNLWMQEASKYGRFVTKKVGTKVNPADLMTKPLAKPKIKQLMGIMGYEFMWDDVDSKKGRSTGTG